MRSSPDSFNVAPTASNNRPLRSGELARRAGVSPDTLRHYERRGLLPRPQRSAAGYRLYSPEALARVRLIRGALRANKDDSPRSEEHTSELQSLRHIVCRLLL